MEIFILCATIFASLFLFYFLKKYNKSDTNNDSTYQNSKTPNFDEKFKKSLDSYLKMIDTIISCLKNDSIIKELEQQYSCYNLQTLEIPYSEIFQSNLCCLLLELFILPNGGAIEEKSTNFLQDYFSPQSINRAKVLFSNKESIEKIKDRGDSFVNTFNFIIDLSKIINIDFKKKNSALFNDELLTEKALPFKLLTIIIQFHNRLLSYFDKDDNLFSSSITEMLSRELGEFVNEDCKKNAEEYEAEEDCIFRFFTILNKTYKWDYDYKKLIETYNDEFNPMSDDKLEYVRKNESLTYDDRLSLLGFETQLIKDQELESLKSELDSFVGLTKVKDVVNNLINLIRVNELRKKNRLKQPPISLHLVFLGNPGTGKTTVARILARIYKNLGVLSKGQLIETDRSGLVAGYVGQTALKTKEVIEKAKGGILFIDEAYSLASNERNDFGHEAIDTLLKAMEDFRDDFVVIVAGYPNLMKKFIMSNPGLQSRFNTFIEFEDYTPTELLEILLRMCKTNGYTISKNIYPKIINYFENIYLTRDETFANGRTVRNFFENAIKKNANRLSMIENPTRKDLQELLEEDLF